MSQLTDATPQPQTHRRRGAWGLGLVIALAVPVALYGLAFAFVPGLNPDFHARLMAMPGYASAHFLGSGLALLIGGFQFSTRLRQRHVSVHRWVGRLYLGAVLVGGIGGLAVAGIAHGGPPTTTGFTLLGALWLYSGARAYAAIRAGDVDGHRRWMLRNFALTFAAVTLRLELGLLVGALGWSFDHAYLTVAWLCWVPNLVVVEWWLLRPPARTAAA